MPTHLQSIEPEPDYTPELDYTPEPTAEERLSVPPRAAVAAPQRSMVQAPMLPMAPLPRRVALAPPRAVPPELQGLRVAGVSPLSDPDFEAHLHGLVLEGKLDPRRIPKILEERSATMATPLGYAARSAALTGELQELQQGLTAWETRIGSEATARAGAIAREDVVRQEAARKAFGKRLEIHRRAMSDTLAKKAEADERIAAFRIKDRRDTPTRIVHAIAIALGEFGRGLAGGGPNTALQIINDSIDRDIAGQKEQLESLRERGRQARSDLGIVQEIYQSDEQSEAALRALYQSEVAGKLAVVESAAQTDKGRMAAAILRQHMELAGQKSREDIAGMAATAEAERQAAMARAAAAQAAAAAKANERAMLDDVVRSQSEVLSDQQLQNSIAIAMRTERGDHRAAAIMASVLQSRFAGRTKGLEELGISKDVRAIEKDEEGRLVFTDDLHAYLPRADLGEKEKSELREASTDLAEATKLGAELHQLMGDKTSLLLPAARLRMRQLHQTIRAKQIHKLTGVAVPVHELDIFDKIFAFADPAAITEHLWRNGQKAMADYLQTLEQGHANMLRVTGAEPVEVHRFLDPYYGDPHRTRTYVVRSKSPALQIGAPVHTAIRPGYAEPGAGGAPPGYGEGGLP